MTQQVGSHFGSVTADAPKTCKKRGKIDIPMKIEVAQGTREEEPCVPFFQLILILPGLLFLAPFLGPRFWKGLLIQGCNTVQWREKKSLKM